MTNKVLFLAMFFSFSAYSQLTDGLISDNVLTIKEVVTQGSIDGKSIFMVYGLNDLRENLGDNEAFVDGIKRDAINIKSLFVDSDDLTSVPGSFKQIDEPFIKRIKPGVLDSVYNMNEAFEEQIELGQDSYHSSKSRIGGSVKLGARAIWATTLGAYYLLLEVPVKSVSNLSASLLSTPVRLGASGVRLAWNVTKLSARTVFQGLSMVAQSAYSITSTSVASGVVIVTSAVLKTGQVFKTIFYNAPKKIFYPITVKKETKFSYTKLSSYRSELVSRLESTFDNLTFEIKKDSKYKSKVVGFNEFGKKMMLVSMNTVDDKIQVRLDSKRKLYSDYKTQQIDGFEIVLLDILSIDQI